MKHSDIKHLCEKGDEQALNLISQHNIQNALDIIDIGYYPAGIDALIPSKILHQIFLGLNECALKAFLKNLEVFPRKKLITMERHCSQDFNTTVIILSQ